MLEINFLFITTFYFDRREFGLERFVPVSLMESMKRKELRKLLSHLLKLNQTMTGTSHKCLTSLQAKLYYLSIISELPSYGAKCFSTNIRVSHPENKQTIALYGYCRPPITVIAYAWLESYLVVKKKTICRHFRRLINTEQAQLWSTSEFSIINPLLFLIYVNNFGLMVSWTTQFS